MAQGKRQKKRDAGMVTVLWGLMAVLAVWAVGAGVLRLTPQGGQETEPPPPEESLQEPEAPPEPVPEPPPEPAPSAAQQLLETMTLREKVCQLFVVFPVNLAGPDQVTEAGEPTRLALEQYPVGGLIYDRTNMAGKEQVRDMLAAVQSYSRIPLLLACDEEGGRVNRLMATVGTTYIGPMLQYKDQGVGKAAENARIIASDMAALGFNVDFAPVADVWSNPKNTVIGDRAYSDDFSQAADLVAAAVEGFHQGGVACALKHFPGHGDTSADSHNGSVYVYKTLDQLREAELLPFRAGIGAGADMVMIGHLIISGVSEEPALLSPEIVTDLLREELGFTGVVITDSLQMRAMTDVYGAGEIAVGAVLAGVDLLLCPENLEEAVDALTAAVESGEIPESRLDESVLRILAMKEARGLLPEM